MMTMAHAIPHTVHRIWFDMGAGPEPPARYQPMRESLAEHHPRWTIVDWDRTACESLLRKHHPWFLETWHGYAEDIMRADAIRYFILYTLGGVYVDHDVAFLRPMDPMVAPPRVNVVITSERWPRHPRVIDRALARVGTPWPRMVNNFVMASARGSLLMRAAMVGLANSHASILNTRGSSLATINMAGPGYFGRIVSRHLAQVGAEPVAVLPPCAFADVACAVTTIGAHLLVHADSGYGTHHFDGSWGAHSSGTRDAWRLALVLVVGGIIVAAITFIAVGLWPRRPTAPAACQTLGF